MTPAAPPADLDPQNIPAHVAVIMDGNGRWARQQGNTRLFGHRNAIRAVRETAETAAELGCTHLTLYAFSTENWSRPKLEVEGLMQLLYGTLQQELPTLQENGIRLHSIGETGALPERVFRALEDAKAATAGGTRMTLTLALNYGARHDLCRAVQQLAAAAAAGRSLADEITPEAIAARLSTAGMPDPALIIRTSGEARISNFLLWEAAYSELYFTNKFWPEFRKADFQAAIADYQRRERRFGRTGEQVKTS